MRRLFIVLLSLVVLAGMSGAVWRYVRSEGPVPRLVVAEVAGRVTVERPGQGSASAPPVEAAEGQVLEARDRLATGEGARAELLLGRDTRIRIGSTSSLQVLSVEPSGVSLELEDGALEAVVRPDSGAVRVGNRGREVLATQGSFQVGVRGEVLQVVADQGEISLVGMDRTRLEAGEQATVVDRHASVEEVPEELLLAVDWPAEARTAGPTGAVAGRTSPGARVVVRGRFGERSALADAEGRFEVAVELGEGENEVLVIATDLLGRTHQVPGVWIRDSRGPAFQGSVRYDPGGQR